MPRIIISVTVAGCLVACGSSVDDQIEALARGGDEGETAAQELLLNPKRAVTPLLRALDSPRHAKGHPVIAEVLVSLLLRIDDDQLLTALRRHATAHPDPAVRSRIAFRTGMLKRAELLDAMMEVVQDTLLEVSYEALKTLNILDNRLSDEQRQTLDALARVLASSPHDGIMEEGLLRVEALADKILVKAEQFVTQARLDEAEKMYAMAAETAPQSWKARYRHARFLLDNGRQEAGLGRLRELGTVMEVSRLSVPPTVDGQLDDEVWKHVAAVRLPFLSYRGYVLPADMESRVYLGYTEDALYVGVYCHDAEIDSLDAKLTQRDESVWGEDSVEIFLDANLDRRSYVQLVISGIGTLFDAVHENGLRSQQLDWSGDIAVAAHQGTDFWSVECKVGFDSKWLPEPRPGDRWGANFARNFRDRSHSSQWVYTYGEYHQVDGFGMLEFK